MKTSYTISEFYLLLKLGIFKQGQVGNWGYITTANAVALRKPHGAYRNELFKTPLDTNTYLLDFYPLNNNRASSYKDFILVIGIRQLQKREYIYILKLTSANEAPYLKTAIENSDLAHKRKSMFRRKGRVSTFDASPLNTAPRSNVLMNRS